MIAKLGAKIAEGGCSEVFEWDTDARILKLAKANTDHAAMRREFERNRLAWEQGLPAPQPFELVEIQERPGIVQERVYGDTVMSQFMREAREPSADSIHKIGEAFRIVARALADIHSKVDVPMNSPQRHTIRETIRHVRHLTSSEKDRVIAILGRLPQKHQLCHGDPNPNNFLITPEGRTVVIDWMNASIGNPEADLAEFIIMVRYAILPANVPGSVHAYLDSVRETIVSSFMDEYSRLTGVTYRDVEPWLIPLAARKLSADGISEDEKQLLVKAIRVHLGQ